MSLSAELHNQIAQRIKNAKLVLTMDSTTHCPFMRRVNRIIKDFKCEKALTIKLPDPLDNGEEKIVSVMEHGRWAQPILSMTNEDIELAIGQTRVTALLIREA